MSDTPTYDALAREFDAHLGGFARRSAQPVMVARDISALADQPSDSEGSLSHYPEARLLLEELRSGRWDR